MLPLLRDPNQLDRIWWSDETTFNMDGTVNRRNEVIWADRNPHIMTEVPMKSVGLTVWAAISSQGIIGPFIFLEDKPGFFGPHFKPCTVTAERYLRMLETFFHPRLLHLYDFQNQWFMQDMQDVSTLWAQRASILGRHFWG